MTFFFSLQVHLLPPPRHLLHLLQQQRRHQTPQLRDRPPKDRRPLRAGDRPGPLRPCLEEAQLHLPATVVGDDRGGVEGLPQPLLFSGETK